MANDLGVSKVLERVVMISSVSLFLDHDALGAAEYCSAVGPVALQSNVWVCPDSHFTQQARYNAGSADGD